MNKQFTYLIIGALALSASGSYSAAPAPLRRLDIIAHALENFKEQHFANVIARGKIPTAYGLAVWQANCYVDCYRISSPPGGEAAPVVSDMEKHTVRGILIQKRLDILGTATFGTPAQETKILQEQSISIGNTFPPKRCESVQ